MQTEIVLTGTGIPIPSPDRAGAGTFVRRGDVALQFDAGRATVLRLAELDVDLRRLSAVFLTHHHSDHLTGLQDLVLTRWTVPMGARPGPLPIVGPSGPSTRFAERMLDVWADDIAIRMAHTGLEDAPSVDVQAFDAPERPTEVWRHGDVVVSAVVVRHTGVEPAVGYRLDVPEGAIVISGDTRVCPEIETLAEGADILVHEVVRAARLRPFAENAPGVRAVLEYHADSLELGEMAKRLDVPRLVLTHLIPSPTTPEHERGFEDDIRKGGYSGEVIVGRDLTRVVLGEAST